MSIKVLISYILAAFLSVIPATSQHATHASHPQQNNFQLDTFKPRLVVNGQFVGTMMATGNPVIWYIVAYTPITASGYFTIDNGGNINVTSTGAAALSGKTGTVVLTVQAVNAGGSGIGTATINYAPTAFRFNTAKANPNRYNIGLNLESVNYFNGQPSFSDIMLQFTGNTGPWDNASGFDSTNAPISCSPSPCGGGLTAGYPSGTYTVSWNGTGSIGLAAGQGTSPPPTLGTPTITNPGPNQLNTAPLTLTQNFTANAFNSLTATPPVTNIHIIVPASSQVSCTNFPPTTVNGICNWSLDFLTKTQPFSTFRFMDSLNSNTFANSVNTWSQRTCPTCSIGPSTNGFVSPPNTGMAYERIVELANITGKDVWINIPVQASDNYVCRLARLFKYGESGANDNGSNCSLTAPASPPYSVAALNSQSHVYVEFGNEIWNYAFQEIHSVYCMANGTFDDGNTGICTVNGITISAPSPGMNVASAALNNPLVPFTPTATNPFQRAQELAYVITKRNNDVFKQVFGATSSQVINIINQQACCTLGFDAQLVFLQQYDAIVGKPYGYGIDAIAIAPYISDGAATDTACGISVANCISYLQGLTATNGTLYGWVQTAFSQANKYGLILICYEGGQGVAGFSTPPSNEGTAQTDPGMYTVTQSFYTQDWAPFPGRLALMNYYEYSGNTSIPAGLNGPYWGALSSGLQPGSQKWDAIYSLIVLPGDVNGDGVVNQTDCSIVKSNLGLTPAFWAQGDLNHDGAVGADDEAIVNSHLSSGTCP